MSEFKVSVVIPVWNEWNYTKTCLDTLRPTLGIHDEVIVVDNGSRDETPKGLKQYPWLKVVTNEENHGFAKGCNQGAAVATGDIIIFLNNDTILTTRWIDGLVWPFQDETVVATGPRSNSVVGEQLVNHVDYDISRMSTYRQWARDWREAHKRETSETARLVGFCIAVRRADFEEVGGFDEAFGIGAFEDDDLCRRLSDRGRLLICHESFVHHVGHVTFDANNVNWMDLQSKNLAIYETKHGARFMPKGVTADRPLLSACMIIKDETENLSRCLTSLNGVVDEVVIYDTGSTDNSIELAEQAGAKVIAGYWDHDFGRARNAALEECIGRWVMHIDADEIFEGNAAQFRSELENSRQSSLVVEVENLSDNGKQNVTHRPCRVFMRDFYHWKGRLHEQVTTRFDEQRMDVGVCTKMRIIHFGYLTAAVEAKNKAARNLEIAEIDAASENGRDMVDKLTNLGRSLGMAGRFEEAYAHYEEARKLETNSDVLRRTLIRAAAQTAINLGRPQEAFSWLDEGEKYAQQTDTLKLLRGWAHVSLEQWTEGLRWLNSVSHPMKDDDNFVFSEFIFAINKARALNGLGRYGEAVDALNGHITKEAQDEPVWALYVDCCYKAGRSFGDVLNQLDTSHINDVLAQLKGVDAPAADAVLEHLWENEEVRANVLALAIRCAPELEIERALDWSVRLRDYGLGEHCPLIAIGFNGHRKVAERLRAAAVAFAAFQDERAIDCVRQSAQRLLPESFAVALSETSAIAPELLEPLVLATATNPSRCLDMGKALYELGATDEGVAVVVHGLDHVSEKTVVEQAKNWLESVGRKEEAAALTKAQ